jgi:D-glycerate 3-kinase
LSCALFRAKAINLLLWFFYLVRFLQLGLVTMVPLIQEFIKAHRLPKSFAAVARDYYAPVGERIAGWQQAAAAPLGVALNGGQGTGKSTFASFLALYLEQFYGLRVFVLSLDDLYKTRAERAKLGASVHPLLATRGVPGTHDLKIGMEVARGCLGYERKNITSPVFEKENDERAAHEAWHRVSVPVDVLILEGWCVSAIPEPEGALLEPINALERESDPDGIWRRYVNTMLQGSYQNFFELFPRKILLGAPSFECILRWRKKQERKLHEKLAASEGPKSSVGLMSDAAVAKFVMHYERLTRWMLTELPGRADVCIHLNEEHGVNRLVVQDDDCA